MRLAPALVVFAAITVSTGAQPPPGLTARGSNQVATAREVEHSRGRRAERRHYMDSSQPPKLAEIVFQLALPVYARAMPA